MDYWRGGLVYIIWDPFSCCLDWKYYYYNMINCNTMFYLVLTSICKKIMSCLHLFHFGDSSSTDYCLHWIKLPFLPIFNALQFTSSQLTKIKSFLSYFSRLCLYFLRELELMVRFILYALFVLVIRVYLSLLPYKFRAKYLL